MAVTKCLLICLFLCLFQFGRCSDVLCEQGYCREHMFDVGCTTPAQHCHINNATHTGLWLPSPTICNCCPYCLPFFGENEHCSTGGPGTGVTVGRCGAGLTCVPDPSDGHNYCQRMTSTCHRAQDDFDVRQTRGEVGSLEQRPHCDGKGKYAAFDCVPAHTCFCQSEEGERLFGEVLYMGSLTTQNMHCGCSRLNEKIKRTIQPGVPHPVMGPRCTADGNFHPIQCINTTCYCVDKVSGVVLENTQKVDLSKEPLTKLDCYDSELDLFPQQNQGTPPFNYTTPCIEDMTEKMELIQQSEKEGYIVDFFNTLTECMPDGTYGRVVRTRNGTKICVDERGQQIDDYEAKPNTPEYDSMDCKCAETSLLMAESAEQPVCCKNGNFRRIQCRRGFCRCVDSDGRQQRLESEDVIRLSCYSADWRTC